MHKDNMLELVANHKESTPPLLVTKFEFTSDNERKEKVQASLYDKYILIKLKVPSKLSQKQTKETFLRIKFDFDLIFTLLRAET